MYKIKERTVGGRSDIESKEERNFLEREVIPIVIEVQGLNKKTGFKKQERKKKKWKLDA